MKTRAVNNITSGFSILSLVLLLIVSFSVEASAKRRCESYGHSCFGGHGKRSSGDDETRLEAVVTDTAASIDDILVNLRTNEIQQLRDFMKCRNCAVESSPSARDDQDLFPLLLRQLIVSLRHPYDSASPTNDK